MFAADNMRLPASLFTPLLSKATQKFTHTGAKTEFNAKQQPFEASVGHVFWDHRKADQGGLFSRDSEDIAATALKTAVVDNPTVV